MNEEKFKRVTRILKNADTHPFDDDFIKDYIQSIEKENQQLKQIEKEHQKINGELRSNWNELKQWLEDNWEQSQDIWFVKIINKLNELEGKDENNT